MKAKKDKFIGKVEYKPLKEVRKKFANMFTEKEYQEMANMFTKKPQKTNSK